MANVRPVPGAEDAEAEHDSDRGVLEHFQGAPDCDAALDVGAQLRERQLDPGECRGDVEDVVVADVADAEYPPLERSLAGRERNPETVADRGDISPESMPSGAFTAVTTAERSSSGENG